MKAPRIAFAAIALLLGGWLATGADSKAAQETPPGFELGGNVKAGRKIFKQYCQKCHGKKGNGQGLMAKDLDPKPRNFTDTERMSKRSDWQIFLGIKEGGAAVGLSEEMTSWKDTLTEQEMRNVAAYIRQFAK